MLLASAKHCTTRYNLQLPVHGMRSCARDVQLCKGCGALRGMQGLARDAELCEGCGAVRRKRSFAIRKGCRAVQGSRYVTSFVIMCHHFLSFCHWLCHPVTNFARDMQEHGAELEQYEAWLWKVIFPTDLQDLLQRITIHGHFQTQTHFFDQAPFAHVCYACMGGGTHPSLTGHRKGRPPKLSSHFSE